MQCDIVAIFCIRVFSISVHCVYACVVLTLTSLHSKKSCYREWILYFQVELGHKRVRVEGVELYHMGQQSLLGKSVVLRHRIK